MQVITAIEYLPSDQILIDAACKILQYVMKKNIGAEWAFVNNPIESIKLNNVALIPKS